MTTEGCVFENVEQYWEGGKSFIGAPRIDNNISIHSWYTYIDVDLYIKFDFVEKVNDGAKAEK